jgi:phosphocarrier protein
MIQREMPITNELGIHARPASLIVQTAKRFKSDIWIEKDGVTADAKSIMNIMMLAASKKSMVTIRAKGPDEQQALETIARLFENQFNEM